MLLIAYTGKYITNEAKIPARKVDPTLCRQKTIPPLVLSLLVTKIIIAINTDSKDSQYKDSASSTNAKSKSEVMLHNPVGTKASLTNMKENICEANRRGKAERGRRNTQTERKDNELNISSELRSKYHHVFQ